MKKLYTLFLLSIFLPVFSVAQEQWKIPLSLYSKISTMNPTDAIGILVEGNAEAVSAAAKKYGGFLRYHQGTICSVQLPSGNLVAFSKEPGIIRIGNDVNNQVLNDTMKIQSNVYPARLGMAPLTQGYSGDNVIIGLIDSGIDFNHPDFKDSAGNTRILKLWDQRDANGPGPGPWNYGTLWDSAAINAGLCTHDDLAFYGHGTGVTGLAAGDGSSVSAVDYSGVAPKADIIMVALDFGGSNSPVAVADAAAYIYQTAAALGRPVVINASVGDYLGSHDGQDLQALMIDSLITAAPSQSFVCAIGNAGAEKIHLSYPLTLIDTNFTWFVTNSGDIYIQTWADTNNFNAAKFAIGCTKDGSFTEKGRTGFTNMAANLSVMTTDSIMNANGQRMATVLRFGSIQGSAYSMEFLISPDSAAGYNYSLQMTGAGLFHCWSFDMYANALPSPLTYPKILFYKSPDTTYTVCSSFQCSDKTICVGNYCNRSSWMCYDGSRTYDLTVTGGDIMWNSSVGPTRDGRVRPDITAPGANTISCGVLSMMPAYISGAVQYVGVGGFHIAGGGSSASSPVVAGSVALYLERFPTADYSQIKTAVTSCAHTDGFTGVALPDNTWGYGKVDAFSMLTNCGLSVSENNAGENAFQLFPNPVNDDASVQLQFNAVNEACVMEIYSVSGQVIFSQAISADATSATVPAGLSTGIYFVRVSNDHFSNAQKLVVE